VVNETSTYFLVEEAAERKIQLMEGARCCHYRRG